MFVQLCDLYNNDSIFDKFECSVSGDGLHFATGSYRFVLLTQMILPHLDMINISILIAQSHFDLAIFYVSSPMVLEVQEG